MASLFTKWHRRTPPIQRRTPPPRYPVTAVPWGRCSSPNGEVFLCVFVYIGEVFFSYGEVLFTDWGGVLLLMF